MTWRVISSSPAVNSRSGDFFAAANSVDQAEIRRGQHAEVLAVLLVDALDVLGDHQLDAGRHLGIRRLLAAGAFAAPLAADAATKPPRFTSPRLIGVSLPHFSPA